MDHPLPYSESCERNKAPILNVLKKYICDDDHVLEIGHGTGQHAIYFSQHLNVQWHPSDLEENNWMMKEQLLANPQKNITPPITVQAGSIPLKKQTDLTFNIVFTANTLHIMSEENALTLCREIGSLLKDKGYLIIYGPFKFSGEFTSTSNESFQQWLQNRAPHMGIRDFEPIKENLEANGMTFVEKIDLPANNHVLVFQKK